MKKILMTIFLSLYLLVDLFSFSGNGTKHNPFLISSFKDLKDLQEAVDSGISFAGMYFEQTKDISFPNGNWNGIGEVEKAYAFYGNYDGAGHIISDFYCDEKYAGLFSLLGGEVKNLGIESGFVTGSCIGGIASHGVGNPKIINCYNKATVIATARAGGIADNFGAGEILFCWNLGDVRADNYFGVASGICSYGASLIRGCFCVQENVAAKTFQGKNEDSFTCDFDSFGDCLTAYYNLLKSAKKTPSYSVFQLFPLVLKGDRISFLGNSIGDINKADEKSALFALFDKYPYQGHGTKQEPYLISSYGDFAAFRDFVDMGESYEGLFFEQTADIVFPDTNWNPVGERSFGFSYGFEGCFDGKGFKLSNIHSDDEFAALFAYIGGEIKNVNIESGKISGDWVSSIANEAGEKSKIDSCTNKANLEARVSASGIVENSRGFIINCNNYGEIVGLRENTNLDGICQFPLHGQIIVNCISDDSLIKNAKKTIKHGVNIKKIFMGLCFCCLIILIFMFLFNDKFDVSFRLLHASVLVKNKIFLFVFLSLTSFSFIQLFFGDKYGYYFTVNQNPSYAIPGDTHMDLYNSIIEESGDKWGQKNMEIYPPLAIFPYQVLVRLLPPELISNNGSHNRDKAVFLRNSMPGGVIGIVYDLLFILPFILLCVFFIHGDKWRRILYTVLLTLSGVMVFTLERGNIISYSMLFLLLFVILYEDSENKGARIIAYICLAISANLKIYPACFGLLLLEKRDFKGIWHTVFLTWLIYSVFFFLCGYAPSEFGKNFLNVFSVSDSMTGFLTNLNYSSRNFLMLLNFLLVRISDRFYLLDFDNIIFKVYTAFTFFAGIFSFFFATATWKKLSAPALLCILIPTMSWAYTLVFLFIPLLYFLNDYEDSKTSRYYAVLFAMIISILIIPISMPLTRQLLTGNFVVQDFALQLLALSLFLESVKNFLGRRDMIAKKICATIGEVRKICLRK